MKYELFAKVLISGEIITKLKVMDTVDLVYIILVNYNKYEDTIQCIENLKKIKYRNYKIIVVDNASTNDSIIHIKKMIDDNCIIIESRRNLGFSGGNNIGIKYALENSAEYILLLNNDTYVENNFLDNMIEKFFYNEKIGVVGCKIMYYPEVKKIWYGGGKINWFKFIVTQFGQGQIDNGQYDVEREVEFITGCCMLIKRDVFNEIGLLPEEYFMYFEDADFCVMVKNHGYKLYYEPKSVIYHKVGLSSGGEESEFSIKWATRNRLIFMSKYKSKVNIFVLIASKAFFYSTRIIKYIMYVFKGQKQKADAIIKGISLYKNS